MCGSLVCVMTTSKHNKNYQKALNQGATQEIKNKKTKAIRHLKKGKKQFMNRKVARSLSNVIKMHFQKKWLTTFSDFVLN